MTDQSTKFYKKLPLKKEWGVKVIDVSYAKNILSTYLKKRL
jgi:hypothetical protein